MNTNTCIANLNATLSVKENKENKTMNAMNFVTKIARRAAALLVFAGMLAFSHQSAAHADVEILSYLGSAETVAPVPAVTAMRFLVYNTDGYTVSGVKVQASLSSFNDFTMPSSSAFSLNAHQTKWITIALPAKGNFGRPLLNQPLTGFGYIVGGGGNSPVYDVSFQNVAPAPDIQSGNPTVTSTSYGVKTFRVPFTNDGYAASTQQTVTVTTWLYADGQVGPALTHQVTLPALQVGETGFLTFSTQFVVGYDIHGTIQVGSGNTVHFSL